MAGCSIVSKAFFKSSFQMIIPFVECLQRWRYSKDLSQVILNCYVFDKLILVLINQPGYLGLNSICFVVEALSVTKLTVEGLDRNVF